MTVLRGRGLRVMIFLNDHAPAHVHVSGDGEAKINLRGEDGAPSLVWASAMGRGEVRMALRIVREHQGLLLERWEELHA